MRKSDVTAGCSAFYWFNAFFQNGKMFRIGHDREIKWFESDRQIYGDKLTPKKEMDPDKKKG